MTTITIPTHLDNVLKNILEKEGYNFLTSRNKVNSKTETIYNRFLLLTHHIYVKYNSDRKRENKVSKFMNFDKEHHDGFTFMNVDFDFGSEYLSKLVFTDRAEISKMLAILVKHNILLLVKRGDSYSHSLNKYKVSSMFQYKAQRVELTSQVVKNQYINSEELYEKKIWDEMSFIGKDLSIKYNELMFRLTFPTLEEVRKKFISLLGTKSKKDKLYVLKYEDGDWIYKNNIKIKNCKKVCIEEEINNYENFLNRTKNNFNHREDDNRYFTDLTNLNHVIRDMILLDGKKLIENDFTAMHNRIIPMLACVYCELLTEDSHEKLGKLLGVSRQEAKQIGLSYWNSELIWINGELWTKGGELFRKMDNFLKTEYRGIWDFLVETKKDNHSNMSRLLFMEERRIMEKVRTEFLQDKDFIYCFDCYYTTVNIKNQMESILNEEINELFSLYDYNI